MFTNNPSDGLILLTGAGASGYMGLPTLDQLLSQACINISNDEVTSIILDAKRSIEAQTHSAAIFEEIIAKLREYTSIFYKLRTDPNISKRTGHLPPVITTGSLEYKYWNALTNCYRVMLNKYGPNSINFSSQQVSDITSLIYELANVNRGDLHLFTTNYDCAYQLFATKLNSLDFLSHISNTDGIFSDNWYSVRKDLQCKNLPKVYIHRLHGCVAWYKNEDAPYKIEEVYGAGSSLEIIDDKKLHNMCIKLVSHEEIGTNRAFFSAFQEFNELLIKARCLLIWGFSFRDREVVRAINNIFFYREKPLLIYYIDPYRDENNILNNIRQSISTVPVRISDNFRPKQIKWDSRQSGEDLINKTILSLEGCMKNV
jgi:hypothetical protein